jgi:hypothetical protein
MENVMPGMNELLVRVATDARASRRFRERPQELLAGSGLTGVEETVLLSRNPELIQAALHTEALKDSLKNTQGDATWTVIIVL